MKRLKSLAGMAGILVIAGMSPVQADSMFTVSNFGFSMGGSASSRSDTWEFRGQYIYLPSG